MWNLHYPFRIFCLLCHIFSLAVYASIPNGWMSFDISQVHYADSDNGSHFLQIQNYFIVALLFLFKAMQKCLYIFLKNVPQCLWLTSLLCTKSLYSDYSIRSRFSHQNIFCILKQMCRHFPQNVKMWLWLYHSRYQIKFNPAGTVTQRSPWSGCVDVQAHQSLKVPFHMFWLLSCW